MAWITVPIFCVVEDLEADQIREANVILESLNLPIKEFPPVQTEVREAEIQTTHIINYYPSNNPLKTIMECVNTNYSIALPKAAIKKIIAKAEGNG